MAITDFECAIAKSQIGRYVAGDQFSDEAVRQLESHIAACPSCKGVIAQRRKDLMSMLGNEQSTDIVAAKASSKYPVESSVTVAQVTQDFTSSRIPVSSQAVISIANDEEGEGESEMVSAGKSVRSSFSTSVTDTNVGRLFGFSDRMQMPERPDILSEPAQPAAHTTGPALTLSEPATKAKMAFPSIKIPNLLGSFKFPSIPGVNAPVPLPTTSDDEPNEVPQAPNKVSLARPIAFAVSLSLVIGAMGMIVKPPTNLLGDKAYASTAESLKAPQPVTAQPKPKAPTIQVGLTDTEIADALIKGTSKPVVKKVQEGAEIGATATETASAGSKSASAGTESVAAAATALEKKPIKIADTKNNPRAEAWRRLRKGEPLTGLKLPGVDSPAKKAALDRHNKALLAMHNAKIAKAAKAAKAKATHVNTTKDSANPKPVVVKPTPVAKVAHQAAPHKAAHKATKHAAKKRHPKSSVTVYDETGRPIR